jgi:hypothetical protein
MNTITVHADSKITKVLIAIFKALSVSFEVKKDAKKEEKPYNPEFVKMVLEARNGKRKRVNPDNIWESIM